MSFPTTVRSGASALVAAFALASLPTPAWAQGADRVILRPSVSVSQEYTDNAFRNEGSDARGDSVTEFRPALGLISHSETGKTELAVGARIGAAGEPASTCSSMKSSSSPPSVGASRDSTGTLWSRFSRWRTNESKLDDVVST